MPASYMGFLQSFSIVYTICSAYYMQFEYIFSSSVSAGKLPPLPSICILSKT